MIRGRTVFCLGLAQLVAWGISYYLIGGFGEVIAADRGWSRDAVYGGFSAALVVMGLASRRAGHLIDRRGGRGAMIIGALLNAAGCAGLALGDSLPAYYASWLLLGLAMRLTLYDAAFAALARIGGPQARRAMSQITLLGGLSSTVFWPLGHQLAQWLGWRGALLAFAGFALFTVPLYLVLPDGRPDGHIPAGGAPLLRPVATEPRDLLIAGALYAAITTFTNFLNAGMSAHMIGILGGLGVAASAAVWIATLRGIGQSVARLAEVFFGRRLAPLTLNVFACLLLPIAFAAGLLSGKSAAAALAFAFLYGAGNGILTITRGTMPLVLFDHRAYGAVVGRLLAPSFILSAAAPVVYAWVIARGGEAGALGLSAAIAAATLAAALVLQRRFARRATHHPGRPGEGNRGE